MIMFCVGMPNFRKITRSKFENYRYFQQCSIIWSSNSASDRFFTTVMDGIGRHVDLFHPQFRSPKTSTYSIPSNFWLFAPPPKQVFSKVGTNQYFKAWYHSLNNSDFVLFWVDNHPSSLLNLFQNREFCNTNSNVIVTWPCISESYFESCSNEIR